MTLPMSNTALLDAISRLDQAVARAEAALDARPSAAPDAPREDAIRAALAEVETLIESLGGAAHV